MAWTTGQGPVAGSCKHGNEPWGFIKGGEFLDKLSDCHLLEKDFAPWRYGVRFQRSEVLNQNESELEVFFGSLSPRHGTSSSCGWRRRPSDMVDSCEYVE
jgi:hypothetical protein